MPLRVLFVTLNYAPGTVGGAERQAQLQAEALVRRGHEVAVVCPMQPGTASGPVNGIDVRRLRVPIVGPLRRPMLVAKLSAYLLRQLGGFDLVHVHLAGVHNDFVAAIARRRRVPLYVKLAAGGSGGDIARYNRLPFIPHRYGLLRAARVQAISDEIASELRAIGIEGEQLIEIPNGLDLRRFPRVTAPGRLEARRRLELPEDEPIVLYVGRFHREKGVPDLLELWGDPARRPAATLVMVGSHYFDDVDRASRLPAGVISRGFSANVLDYYHAADVFVLPSYTEGMSNALLEAMACGLPAVATRVGSAEAMIADGENGLLIYPGRLDELSEALGRLLADEGLRARMGAAAADSVQRYDVERVVDRIEAAYGEILEQQGARPAGRAPHS